MGAISITQATKPLYEQIADRIHRQIEEGALKPGERIPSVRKLKAKMRVSLSTVLQAYVTLESKGLIEARPQSGYYVRLHSREFPMEPKMSAPSRVATKVDISRLALQVHDNNLNPAIVPLGAATPSPDLLPTRKLNRILRSLSRKHEAEISRYESPSGNMELRRQIARRSVDWGCNLLPDEILITVGCSEALNLCLRAVTKPGDTVAVESPTYFGFLQILEALNLKALEIATDPREGMCLNSLESAIRKNRIAAVFVQPDCQNPLGCSMPDKKKKELVRLLSRKEIPLIEDDIYADLHFPDIRPRVLKSFDNDGNVLSCSSFSKTLSPGFRIGWTSPGRFMDAVRRLKLTNSISTATLPQMVIAEMLSSGGYDHYLRRARRTYLAQVQIMIQAVRRHFPEGTRVTRPKGGTVLWVELPESINALDMYEVALQKNISIVPGPLFSAKREFRNCIRLSCGNTWSDQIEDAMITLGQIAARML